MTAGAAYYNEIDPYVAAWLRNLIAAGHIAPGDVDERSIEDVHPDDLRPYTQCHFFAGIGVWSYALRLAGWPDDRPVWTGSCPCQPFSAAGKGAGFDDERHLWPAWHWLIQQRRPAKVFGEQVASKDAEPWLDLIFTDLEAMDYACGAVPFPAAGIGSPHIRDRLYWMADSGFDRRNQGRQRIASIECNGAFRDRSISGLGDTLISGRQPVKNVSGCHGSGMGPARGVTKQFGETGAHAGRLAHAEQHDSGRKTQAANNGQPQTYGSADWLGRRSGSSSRLADPIGVGRGGRQGVSTGGEHDRANAGRLQGDDGLIGFSETGDEPRSARPTNGHWRDADWLLCRDGKWRPVEPGTFPLAHGAPARVGRLRAYGNAIVAQAAATFIKASMTL